MDFKTAATIAQEQNMFLTTEKWYSVAAEDAKRVPGMVVHMDVYRYVDGKWKFGNKELSDDCKQNNTWRVCAKETLTFNGHFVQ